jgi:hypothetical protein
MTRIQFEVAEAQINRQGIAGAKPVSTPSSSSYKHETLGQLSALLSLRSPALGQSALGASCIKDGTQPPVAKRLQGLRLDLGCPLAQSGVIQDRVEVHSTELTQDQAVSD